ncbi:hypothetical protein [Hymenobacter sp. B81]|uniref:hypothetical protein n=1 Tax=Hymenobacter sp. B81 TaxID=3344878 RepID=UPI0037DC245B
MSQSTRARWAALLLLPLAACGYDSSPGLDHINDDSFSEAPRANRVDTDRDSMSGGGEAYQPVGTTSGNRSMAEASSARPGGDPNTSKYTDSGTTDGTSTTSGRSLTNRGTTDTENITSGQSTGGNSTSGSMSGGSTTSGGGVSGGQNRSGAAQRTPMPSQSNTERQRSNSNNN